MGQKVNPHGLRVGVIKNWDSRWFAEKGTFGDTLVEDYNVRNFILKELNTRSKNPADKCVYAGVPKVEIERFADKDGGQKVRIHIHCAKPGIVIGRGGAEIEKLRANVEKMIGKSVAINIVEVKQPDINAQLVAEKIAHDLEDRISFRRAMKQSIGRAMKLGAKGKGGDDGWAEWSVPKLTNAHDPELWYQTNPSLGTILTERKIRSELGDPKDDQVDDNIQRLGLWLTYNQKSAISKGEWQALCITGKPDISRELFFGIKYAKVTDNVSLAVAAKTTDGKIFVEAIDCRPVREGNGWIIAYLRNPHMRETVIDGANGQSLLAADMKNAGIKRKPILPKVADVITSSAGFERGVFAQNICHADQPSLEQVIANCEHRAISSGGGFGYTSILEGADISLLEAVVLAHWACANSSDKKKVQKISW